MATTRYIIRCNESAINKDGSTIIYLRYTHKGKTSYFSTHKRILPQFWDQQKQCAKRSYKGHSTLQIYLSKFKQKFEDIINKAIFTDIEPTTDYVRVQYKCPEGIIEGKQGKQRTKLSFEKFLTEFIEESKRIKKKPTIRSYTDLVRILEL